MTLRELAEKATPGPWKATGDSIYYRSGPSSELLGNNNFGGETGVFRVNTIGRSGRWPHDRAYIAAASPDVVLRLLAIEEAARSVIEHIDALAGPNAHRLGCECGGTNDGIHSCQSLNEAVALLREALEAPHVE